MEGQERGVKRSEEGEGVKEEEGGSISCCCIVIGLCGSEA